MGSWSEQSSSSYIEIQRVLLFSITHLVEGGKYWSNSLIEKKKKEWTLGISNLFARISISNNLGPNVIFYVY